MEARQTSSWGRADWIATAAVSAVAAVAAAWRAGRVQPWHSDVGLIFDGAYRIATGEVPYKDFLLVTSPLTYYNLAACFKMFGYRYHAAPYLAVGCALLIAMTYLFCARVLKLSRLQCVGLSCLQIIWAPQVMLGMVWYDCDAAVVAMAAGCLLVRGWSADEPRDKEYFLGGVLCALGFWVKQDLGAGLLVGGCLGTLWTALGARSRRWRGPAAFVSGSVLVFLAAGATFAWHGAFGDMWHWVVERALMFKWGETPRQGETIRKLLSPFTTSIDRSSKLVVMMYLAAIVGAWRSYRLSGERRQLALAAVALMWLASLYASLVTHDGQAYAARASTFACTLGIIWSTWPAFDAASPRRRVLGAAFVFGVILVGVRGIYYWSNMTPDTPSVVLRTPRLAGMRVSHKVAALDKMVEYIATRVPPEDDILNLDCILVYFATGRRHPHPIPDFTPPEILPRDEDRVMSDLRRHRVRWYFRFGDARGRDLDPMLGLTGLKAYVRDEFRFKETIDGFTVWTSIAP
ncbi:MAG: hypothetical protein AAB036_04300 [Elusimicrobiota bacterium]